MIFQFANLILFVCITVGQAVPIPDFLHSAEERVGPSLMGAQTEQRSKPQKRQSSAEYILETELTFQPAVPGINLIPYRADQDTVSAFTVADRHGCHWFRVQDNHWQQFDLLPPQEPDLLMTACRFVTLPGSQRSFLWVSYFTNDPSGDNMVHVHEVIAGVIQRSTYQGPFSLSSAQGITWMAISTQDNGLRVGVLGQGFQPWYRWDPSMGSSGAFVYEGAEQLSGVQDYRASPFPNAASPAYWLLFACSDSTCPVRAWNGQAFTRLNAVLPGSLQSVSGCAWGAQEDQPCVWVSMFSGESRLYCLESNAFILRGTFTGPGSQRLECVEPDSLNQQQVKQGQQQGQQQNPINDRLVWHTTTGFTVQYDCGLEFPLDCTYASNTLPGGVGLEVLSSIRIVTVSAAVGSLQTLRVWIDNRYLPPIYGTLQLIAPSQAPTGVDSSTTSITIVGDMFSDINTLVWGATSFDTLQAGTYSLFSQLSNDHGFCTTHYLLPSGSDAPNPVTISIGATTSIRLEYDCPGEGGGAGGNNNAWVGGVVFAVVMVVVISVFVVRCWYSNRQIEKATGNLNWRKNLECGEWLAALLLAVVPLSVARIIPGKKKMCATCRVKEAMEHAECCTKCRCARVMQRIGGSSHQRCINTVTPGYLYCGDHNTCTEQNCNQPITVPGTQACHAHLQKYCAFARQNAIRMAEQGQAVLAKSLVCNEFATQLLENLVDIDGKQGYSERRCLNHGATRETGSMSKRCKYNGDVGSYTRCLRFVLTLDGDYCELHLTQCGKEGCETRIPVVDTRCQPHAGLCISLNCPNSIRAMKTEHCNSCYIGLPGSEAQRKRKTTPIQDLYCHEGFELGEGTRCGAELVGNAKYCPKHAKCQIEGCNNTRSPFGRYYCDAHGCPYLIEKYGQCRNPKRAGHNSDSSNGCREHADGCDYCLMHHDECSVCHIRYPPGQVQGKERTCSSCKK